MRNVKVASFTLGEEALAMLKRAAEREQLAMSALLRHIVVDWCLRNHGKPPKDIS